MESIKRYEQETRELENEEKRKQEKIRKLLLKQTDGNASSSIGSSYDNSSNCKDGNDGKDTVVIELQNHMIDL